MKVKFNSDDGLPLRKTLRPRKMVIITRTAFYEDGKYYPQVLLDEYLCKL